MCNYNLIKDLGYYRKLNDEFNLKYNCEWKKISGRGYVGSCSYLYKHLKPLNYQDFFDKYTTFLNLKSKDKNFLFKRDCENYGRSINDLLNLAEEYRRLTNDYTFTLEQYYDNIVYHVIIETFNGHIPELHIKNILEKNNFYVINEDGDKDAINGVDLSVYWNNKLFRELQIKPNTTFFGGNHNKSLVNDRQRFYTNDINKELKYYMMYDTDSLIKNNVLLWYYRNSDNVCKFKIQELCDDRGISIIRSSDFTKKEIKLNI